MLNLIDKRYIYIYAFGTCFLSKATYIALYYTFKPMTYR